MTRFAQGTHVPVVRSRMEIERMLEAYGAHGFASGKVENTVRLIFIVGRSKLRFEVDLPTAGDFASDKPPQANVHTKRLTPEQRVARLVEAEVRRRWRVLALAIKAKLEAVATGVATWEQEFGMYTVQKNGRTLAENLGSQLQLGFEGSPLLEHSDAA